MIETLMSILEIILFILFSIGVLAFFGMMIMVIIYFEEILEIEEDFIN